jgi:hypothetical protein
MNTQSFRAWLAGLFEKGKIMSDVNNSSNGPLIRPAAPEMTVNDLTAPLSAPVAEVVSAVGQALAPAGDALAGEVATIAEQALIAAVPAQVAPIVAAVLNTDVLKGVLLALGHDLGPVWDDAVALAKKAL